MFTSMFLDVKNFLVDRTQSITKSYFIGVVEEKADSSFLFHHFLSYYLKEGNPVVLLSFCQSFNHFASVGNKIGNSLIQARDKNQFLFIEGLKYLAQATNSDCLKGDNPWGTCFSDIGTFCVGQFYYSLKKTICNFSAGRSNSVVLVIDNISALVDTGASTNDVMALLHYLKAVLCKDMNGCLVVGLNNDLGEEDVDGSQLKKFIQHSADLNLEVKGLETGYCKDVHGQLKATWQKTTSREKSVTKSSQYKLTDKTCVLFASGMSSAVL